MLAVRLKSDGAVHLGGRFGLVVGISSHLDLFYTRFYLLFRSVKKFSFERKKLVFSRVDTHLTRRVLGPQAFLRLTRSSPVPYTKLVSSDATHTLLHDQQTRRNSGLLVSHGRSAVRQSSRSVMPWR